MWKRYTFYAKPFSVLTRRVGSSVPTTRNPTPSSSASSGSSLKTNDSKMNDSYRLNWVSTGIRQHHYHLFLSDFTGLLVHLSRFAVVPLSTRGSLGHICTGGLSKCPFSVGASCDSHRVRTNINKEDQCLYDFGHLKVLSYFLDIFLDHLNGQK